MGKPRKPTIWVIFITGWIIFILGRALSIWLTTLIEDRFVSVLVFFGACFVSVVLLGIGGRMANIVWKVPNDCG
jgi:hypothetical protein